MPVPYISIIIPTKDNEKDLLDCLKSIASLDYSPDKIEVIVWDNNSQQECKKKIKKYLFDKGNLSIYRRDFIENDENFGVYTSRDELLQRVSKNSQFILSIDDDVILPTDSLSKLLTSSQESNQIGMVGPRIVYDDNPMDTAHGAGFISRWLGRYTARDARTAVECDYVIGCCMLIDKRVIAKIGGFDRDYYTSHGEVDFCLKAKKEGFKVLYDPNIIVRHRVDKGGTRTLERIYYIYRNKLLVIKKNWPIPQKWIALFLYSVFWYPKAIIGSLIINKKMNFPEIEIITLAMLDGWLNRFGKRT